MDQHQAASGTLLRTPLYQEHLRLHARLAPFAGWEMPIQYTSIVEEHRAVRDQAGMFDVSHMGRFEARGPQADALLRFLCSYDITRLSPGQGHYAVMCRSDGGILDDVYVYLLAPQRFLLVANAANAERILGWLLQHQPPFQADIADRSLSTAMIAVQGPAAVEACARALAPELAQTGKRRCASIEWLGASILACRTGYTGEDGFELIAPAETAPALWQRLLAAGVTPCGLGSRDTLRLEAALLLYGNDIDIDTNPYEVGLDWVVTLDDAADFIGRQALARLQERGPQRLLACVRAEERGAVMRSGCAVLSAGKAVGTVTSGGFSPTLGVSIGMAFLPPALAAPDTRLDVEVRGKLLPVRVLRRPFYKPGSVR